MPESMKKSPANAQSPVQAKTAGSKKNAPAAPVAANYPPRPAAPRPAHAQPVQPKKKPLLPPAKPVQKRTAPTAPPPQQDPSPADDILELEDIVSTLQTQNPETTSSEEPQFEFDSRPAVAPEPGAVPTASGQQPPIGGQTGANAVQSPEYQRPMERLEYRTSSVRKICDSLADLEPFFTKTTLLQAGIGALLLMLVFLAGVYVGSTPGQPEPEPPAPSVSLQPQIELLSTAAVRNLGAKPPDFGPMEMAKIMIRFIVEQAGREVYVLKFSRGGEPNLFTVDFPNQTIVHTEGIKGSGLILTWKGFVLERLRAAAHGQNFEMTPQGESPANLQRF